MLTSEHFGEAQLDDLYKLLVAVARDKAKHLKLSTFDYLLGILDGTFPPVEPSELARKCEALAADKN